MQDKISHTLFSGYFVCSARNWEPADIGPAAPVGHNRFLDADAAQF